MILVAIWTMCSINYDAENSTSESLPLRDEMMPSVFASLVRCSTFNSSSFMCRVFICSWTWSGNYFKARQISHGYWPCPEPSGSFFSSLLALPFFQQFPVRVWSPPTKLIHSSCMSSLSLHETLLSFCPIKMKMACSFISVQIRLIDTLIASKS